MRIPYRLVLLLLCLSTAAVAQTLTVGPPYYQPYAYFHEDFVNMPAVRTAVDLGNPATATGSIDSVKVFWTATNCSNAFEIKFFRRSDDTLTPYAVRGPFSSTTLDNTITLTPPVNVQQGDLIGVTRLGDCGTIGTQFGVLHHSDGFVEFGFDVTAPVAISAGQSTNIPMTITGSGTATESLVAVIPVVASTTGFNGSNFKSTVQLFLPAPNASSTSGRLVFHPAGASASPGDPSLPYTLAANHAVTFDDVLNAMHVSGLGSLDFVVPAGQVMPVVVARAYNDGGTLGSTGAAEDPVTLTGASSRVLQSGAVAFLLTPPDMEKSRFNVGIRTLFSGATIEFFVLNANASIAAGPIVKTFTQSYFDQQPASVVLGVPINADQTIQVSIKQGSAIVYGATTDNITNDPSIQYAAQ